MASYDAQKTHCINGHPFDEANTHRNDKGHRSCRTCHREREAARREKLPKPRKLTPLEGATKRFWAKVEKGDGCWIWTGDKSQRYGRIMVGGIIYGAHQFSYLIHYGQEPGDMFVCHRCDVPKCVKPDHLFLGTAADNSADMARKGRAANGGKHPNNVRGVRVAVSKLDPEKVREMRRLREEGWEYRPIAAEFGVSLRAAWLAVNRKTWAHVDGSPS